MSEFKNYENIMEESIFMKISKYRENKERYFSKNAANFDRINNIIFRNPDDKTSWLIDVKLICATISNSECVAMLKRYIKYGHSVKYDKFLAVGTGDREELDYDIVTVMVDIFDNCDCVATATKENLKKELGYIINEFEGKYKISVEPRESIDDAILKAQRLEEFYKSEEEYEHDIVITWKPRERQGVLGKEIETLMKELNLEWGDMDLYHLANTCANGDDVLFSVSTNTNPGYFMLNQINEFKYKDLVFIMNIARTYKPVEVFEIMWNGILYIQEKIGGTIVNEKNEDISKEFYIKEINETIKRFNKYGQETGQDSALFLF